MKKTIIFLAFFYFLLVLQIGFALTSNGTNSDGTYSTESSFGNIVERSVNDTHSEGFSSIMFSWGGPLANGTGIEGVSTSGLGVSAAGDAYIMTFGPELEDETASVEQETEEEEIEESGGIPSSGAGGGGGGSSKQDTYGLVIGDKLTVLINKEKHTITILGVRESSVMLLIESKAIEIEVGLGETKEIDFDEDGIADMAVTLDAVSELRKITITVEDLTGKEVTAETRSREEKEQVDPLERITGAVIGLDTEKIEEVNKEVREATTIVVKYVLFANVIAGILVGSMVAAREIKRRRIYSVFHQQTKQELVEVELKKLRQYASTAMKSGRTMYDIKTDLLEAGWFEYEVDEALVDTMLKEKAGFNQMK